MWRIALLIVPVILAVLALRTGRLAFKVGVPASCGAILVLFAPEGAGRAFPLLWVVAALAWSMVGDFFLSNRKGRESWFVLGIAAFLLAHVGYLAFALAGGGVHWLALGILLGGYLAYYLVTLRQAIHAPLLSAAVLFYLVVSCLALAAALGIRRAGASKGLYVAGIALIVFSDTLISFREFLSYRALDGWVLPTYYAAHLCITLSVWV